MYRVALVSRSRQVDASPPPPPTSPPPTSPPLALEKPSLLPVSWRTGSAGKAPAEFGLSAAAAGLSSMLWLWVDGKMRPNGEPVAASIAPVDATSGKSCLATFGRPFATATASKSGEGRPFDSTSGDGALEACGGCARSLRGVCKRREGGGKQRC